MINHVNESILNAKENIIVQQVNCQGKMGSGLALEIREKYPSVYEEYIKLCNSYVDKKVLLGICQLVQVSDDKYVANIFGQEYYGYNNKKYTNFNALIRGLCRLFLNAKCNIAIPYKLGCDRGGGDWEKLYNIISILSEDFKYDVIIYHYLK